VSGVGPFQLIKRQQGRESNGQTAAAFTHAARASAPTAVGPARETSDVRAASVMQGRVH